MTDGEDTPADEPGATGESGERVDADRGGTAGGGGDSTPAGDDGEPGIASAPSSETDTGAATAVRGDRFTGGPARGFMSSLDADKRIFAADLAVDRAHVVMLAEQGIIEAQAAGEILAALDEVESAGHGELPEAEDVHEAIETAVIERIGPTGGRMHTARSRNDEVATCIRYRLRGDLFDALDSLLEARQQLLEVAAAEAETLLPGFTHLQYAQPVTVGHWVLSYEGGLARDTERLLAAYDRTNRSPLGAAAFAGTPFPVDRERTAELLGFAGDPSNEATERSAARGSGGVVENAMDAVSARDFLVETTSAMATLSTTLSGMAEDLVVYSGRGYVEIGDEYASTSSIMPQKKNPDTLELVRASAGEATGALQGLLMTLKGLPRSYNIDLQEATPYAWTAVDVVPEALDVATGALVTAEWNEDVLTEAAKAGFATATGVADRLAMAGLPFRTAHEVVASAAETLEGHPDVATLEAAAQDVLDGSLTDYVDRETLAATLDPADSVGMRDSRGGPSPSAVSTSAARARERLAADRTAVADREATVAAAAETLDQEVTQYGTE